MRDAARFTAPWAAIKYRSNSAVRPCAIRTCIISRLPLMPVRRLLKSCAKTAGQLTDRLHLLGLTKLLFDRALLASDHE